jgi:hypothetical protein
MFARKFTSMIGGALVLGLSVASSGGAAPMAAGQRNYLTFSGPVGLPGVTLPGGTYTFELIPLHPDIVRVLSRDGSRLYFTGFARQVPRPDGVNASHLVTFSETVRGVPPRIKAWYPLGVRAGHEFLYSSAQR